MNLALFDLDHTLIPFDSGMAWTRFLVQRGVLAADAEARYLAYCHQYVAGTLNIHAMHHASLAPLSHISLATLQQWACEFEAAMAPRIPDAMRELVQHHRAAGDLCVLVTATSRLIADPFARLFGLAHVLATEAVVQDGRLTGAIDGEPCFRQYKHSRVAAWLEAQGQRLADFDRSWFYSDSASDLPLLTAVTHPVAVRPDDTLRAHALAAGWAVH